MMNRGSGKAIIIRALHKSASMFLYKFFAQVSRDAGIPYYSVNHSTANQHQVTEAMESSFCVCPIRDFAQTHFTHFPKLDRVIQLFHLRDPRDILVSEYFSLGWIHPDKNWSDEDKARRQAIQKMTIDDYVLNQHEISPYPMLDRFAPLMRIDTSSPNVIISRYETMVTQFYRWAASTITPFGLPWNLVWAGRYAWKYRKEFKSTSDKMSHKRNITPGDHRIKLKPQTIEQLNVRFEPVLTRFGYAQSQAA